MPNENEKLKIEMRQFELSEEEKEKIKKTNVVLKVFSYPVAIAWFLLALLNFLVLKNQAIAIYCLATAVVFFLIRYLVSKASDYKVK